jgi:hypothetical protein
MLHITNIHKIRGSLIPDTKIVITAQMTIIGEIHQLYTIKLEDVDNSAIYYLRINRKPIVATGPDKYYYYVSLNDRNETLVEMKHFQNVDTFLKIVYSLYFKP